MYKNKKIYKNKKMNKEELKKIRDDLVRPKISLLQRNNPFDKEYHKLLWHLLSKGDFKKDRTGTGTISKFGYQARFDLSKGFPLLTTKKLHMKSIIYELLWFLAGDTNAKPLQANGVRIWNEWPDLRCNL